MWISSVILGVVLVIGERPIYSIADHVAQLFYNSIDFPFVSCCFNQHTSYGPHLLQAIIATPGLNNGLSFGATYSGEVISEAEVNVILDHFEAALVFLVNHPHDILGDINLVNAKERQRLVTDLNPGELLSPAQNISELIETQAGQTPEKIAVCIVSMCRYFNNWNHVSLCIRSCNLTKTCS
jgi:non-ribosomal peptide synthetase component F